MIEWNKDRPLIQEGISALGILPRGVYAAPDGDKKNARLLVAADGIHLTRSDFSDLELNKITLQSANNQLFTIGVDDDGRLLINNNVYEPTSNEIAKAQETAQKALDGLNTKVSQSDYNAQISSLNVKADGITQTVTQVSNKVDNLQVGGRNLLSGTNKTYTGVGNNTPNGNFNSTMLIPFVNGWSASDLYANFGNKQLTLSFDWSVTGGTITGTVSPQFSNSPWGVGGAFDATKNSGHYVSTIPAMSSSWNNYTLAKAIMFRQDNFQGTLTVQNIKIEVGNLPTVWTPAPEDTDSKFSQQQQTIDRLEKEIEVLKASMDNAIFIKH